jgi:hypothetical protein
LGLVAIVAGALVLYADVRRASREGSGPEQNRRRRTVLAGAFLLANFPAAAFYVLSAFYVYTRYTVRVRNDGERTTESFVVTGPGTSVEMGPIAPGEHAEAHLRFRGDGSLRFAARQQDRDFGGELDGYVTTNLGGEKTIRLGPHGAVEILDEVPRAR